VISATDSAAFHGKEKVFQIRMISHELSFHMAKSWT